MINNALFSSTTDMWETPKDLFDKLDEEFEFQTDVCAIKQNAKCKRFYTPEQNGLKQIWTGVCWSNPPYGRGIEKWMKKAYESSATVVCLVPARTDTKCWQICHVLRQYHFTIFTELLQDIVIIMATVFLQH